MISSVSKFLQTLFLNKNNQMWLSDQDSQHTPYFLSKISNTQLIEFYSNFIQSNPQISICELTPNEILALYEKYINRKTNDSTMISSSEPDPRDFIFTYFEIINSAILTANCFSVMVLNQSISFSSSSFISQNKTLKIDESMAQNVSLFQQFLEIPGSLEVFVDHYIGLISSVSLQSNHKLIETRVNLLKSITKILSENTSEISRILKIIKKYEAILFKLLRVNDFNTSIETFRCVTSLYTCHYFNTLKKKKRIWIRKLVDCISFDSPNFLLLISFLIKQKENINLSLVASRLIHKMTGQSSLGLQNKTKHKRRIIQSSDDEYENDDVTGCFDIKVNSQIPIYQVLKAVEQLIIEYSFARCDKSKQTQQTSQQCNESANQNTEMKSEIKESQNGQGSSPSKFPGSLPNSMVHCISYIFKIAITNEIMNRTAISIINRILLSFVPSSDENLDDQQFKESVLYSELRKFIIYNIRKAVIMSYIIEANNEMNLFEKECLNIENLFLLLSKSEIIGYSVLQIVGSAYSERKKKGLIECNYTYPTIERICNFLSITDNVDNIDTITTNFLTSNMIDHINSLNISDIMDYPFEVDVDMAIMGL